MKQLHEEIYSLKQNSSRGNCSFKNQSPSQSIETKRQQSKNCQRFSYVNKGQKQNIKIIIMVIFTAKVMQTLEILEDQTKLDRTR